MIRSIGSFTVSFGLVAIPVKLYTATQSAGHISFNLLHKGCGSRLKQQYTCLHHGTVLERDDIVKGYEFAKDQYVEFTPDEIKALEEVGTGAAEIAQFVPLNSIDPLYFDKTYYLGPDKGAAKPYALLVAALTATKRCAIARWASKGKAHVIMLRAMDGVLAMQQLKFSTEVRSAKEIDVAKMDVSAAELKLARQLVEQQEVSAFDPATYTDDVHMRVIAAIDAKVNGKPVRVTKPKAPKNLDLMEALKASLKKVERKAQVEVRP